MDKRPVIGSAGELLVEFVAAERNGRHRRPASYAGPFPSGAPAIFIDQAARVGARALFAGAVGDDAFGAVILERLHQHGVDTAGITVVPSVPTGSAFVSYNDDGSRDFVFNIAHSAAARLAAPQAIAEAMRASGIDIFHISGSSLGDAGMAQALLAVATDLDAHGVALSIDPNIRKELLGDPAYRETLDRLLGMARYVLPSEDDAALLYPGQPFDEFAPPLLASGAEVVVLKQGEAGARGLTRSGDRASMPAFHVPVADPTGAGDCFCATFVTLFAGGMPLAEALGHANAAGALAVGKVGPMEGNSSLEEIEAVLNGGGR